MNSDEIVKWLKAEYVSRKTTLFGNPWSPLDEAANLIEAQQATIRRECEDWAETDTQIRNAAKPFLTEFEINGDRNGVPTIEDIVNLLVKRIASQQKEIAEWRKVAGSFQVEKYDSPR